MRQPESEKDEALRRETSHFAEIAGHDPEPFLDWCFDDGGPGSVLGLRILSTPDDLLEYIFFETAPLCANQVISLFNIPRFLDYKRRDGKLFSDQDFMQTTAADWQQFLEREGQHAIDIVNAFMETHAERLNLRSAECGLPKAGEDEMPVAARSSPNKVPTLGMENGEEDEQQPTDGVKSKVMSVAPDVTVLDNPDNLPNYVASDATIGLGLLPDTSFVKSEGVDVQDDACVRIGNIGVSASYHTCSNNQLTVSNKEHVAECVVVAHASSANKVPPLGINREMDNRQRLDTRQDMIANGERVSFGFVKIGCVRSRDHGNKLAEIDFGPLGSPFLVESGKLLERHGDCSTLGNASHCHANNNNAPIVSCLQGAVVVHFSSPNKVLALGMENGEEEQRSTVESKVFLRYAKENGGLCGSLDGSYSLVMDKEHRCTCVDDAVIVHESPPNEVPALCMENGEEAEQLHVGIGQEFMFDLAGTQPSCCLVDHSDKGTESGNIPLVQDNKVAPHSDFIATFLFPPANGVSSPSSGILEKEIDPGPSRCSWSFSFSASTNKLNYDNVHVLSAWNQKHACGSENTDHKPMRLELAVDYGSSPHKVLALGIENGEEDESSLSEHDVPLFQIQPQDSSGSLNYPILPVISFGLQSADNFGNTACLDYTTTVREEEIMFSPLDSGSGKDWFSHPFAHMLYDDCDTLVGDGLCDTLLGDGLLDDTTLLGDGLLDDTTCEDALPCVLSGNVAIVCENSNQLEAMAPVATSARDWEFLDMTLPSPNDSCALAENDPDSAKFSRHNPSVRFRDSNDDGMHSVNGELLLFATPSILVAGGGTMKRTVQHRPLCSDDTRGKPARNWKQPPSILLTAADVWENEIDPGPLNILIGEDDAAGRETTPHHKSNLTTSRRTPNFAHCVKPSFNNTLTSQTHIPEIFPVGENAMEDEIDPGPAAYANDGGEHDQLLRPMTTSFAGIVHIGGLENLACSLTKSFTAQPMLSCLSQLLF